MNYFDKFLNDYLYPLLSLIVLCLFLGAQARAHETQSAALMAVLHECRNTGTYKTMECATAIVRSAAGEYRTTPITIGTEKTFRLRISYQPGDILVAIFHTHPGRDVNADAFSDVDVRVAEKLDVPSYIFVLRLGEMRIYYPTKRQLAASNVANPGTVATAIGNITQ